MTMENVPRVIKAERDLTGLLTIKFEDLDPEAKEKEFTKAFSELRAGISWPIRAVPGYLCVLGLFAGMQFGTEQSSMLVYEAKYQDAMELMTDAYNRARDLRFQVFYTDCSKPEWKGFMHEFTKKVHGNMGGRDIRLKQSPFPNDFALGKDLIRRIGAQKGFILPTSALLTEQIGNVRAADMDSDHPEYTFPAVNAFRYLIVGWESDQWAQRTRRAVEPESSPLGWA